MEAGQNQLKAEAQNKPRPVAELPEALSQGHLDAQLVEEPSAPPSQGEAPAGLEEELGQEALQEVELEGEPRCKPEGGGEEARQAEGEAPAARGGVEQGSRGVQAEEGEGPGGLQLQAGDEDGQLAQEEEAGGELGMRRGERGGLRWKDRQNEDEGEEESDGAEAEGVEPHGVSEGLTKLGGQLNSSGQRLPWPLS